MKQHKLEIRGLNYYIQEWGSPANPTLFLLHGWMDCGGSYKFIAEHLQDRYHLIAPDWRGFGETDHATSYWFPDYFADLEKILDVFSPNQAANLVAHSMGGNIALMYAGIRPNRVAQVLSLEGLGMQATEPEEAPGKYQQWLDQILAEDEAKIYLSLDALKASIKKGNPTLSSNLIDELSGLWAKPYGDQGQMMLKHDHAHRYVNPVRYNFDDVIEVWKRSTARIGLVMAEDSYFYKAFEKIGRLKHAYDYLQFDEKDYFLIKQSGHMLHIEQPQKVAEAVHTFFSN